MLGRTVFNLTIILSISLATVIVTDAMLWKLGYGYPSSTVPNPYRSASVFDEFSGKPFHKFELLKKVHNEFGFLGQFENSETINPDKISVAFFGGSTGWDGSPTILEKMVNDFSKKGVELVPYNFSSVSSSHSQHIHRLVKFISKYKFDYVIFYGGGNETISQLAYDIRPGYPYNYFFTRELSDERRLLLKYSSLAGEFDKVFGTISGIDKIRAGKITKLISSKGNPYLKIISEEWKDSLASRYIEDLKKAKSIAEGVGTPLRCTKVTFISIRQPASPTRSGFKEVWRHLDEYSKSYSDEKTSNHFDISYLEKTGTLTFTDLIHLNQESNDKIAGVVGNIFQEFLDRCSD